MKIGMTRLRMGINRLLTNSFWGYVLLLGVAVAALLAVVAAASLVDTEVWWNVYYALGINPIDSDSEHRHMWLYLLLGVCGALVLGGLMVTVFTSGVERYVEHIGEGRVRYRRLNGHVVVMGWNAMTPNLVGQLCRKWPKAVVVVVTAGSVRDAQTALDARLDKGERKRVLVYAETADTLGAGLNGLALDKAEEAYITTDDAAGQRPTVDLTLLPAIAHSVEKRKKALRVNVMIDRLETYTMMRQMELPAEYTHSADGRTVLDLRMFNYYENWARLLWSHGSPYRYDLLDFEPVVDGDKRIHLVIVGLGSMGQALLLEALRICHYPGGAETEVTVVDPQSAEAERRLRSQFAALDEIADIKISFRNTTLDDPAMRVEIEEWAKDRSRMLTIAICLPDNDEAMCAALRLPEAIYCQDDLMQTERKDGWRSALTANHSRTRVLVRQSASTQRIIDANGLRYPNLRMFGMVDDGIDIGLLSDELAVTINGLYSDNMMGGQQPTDIQSNRERWADMWLETSEASKHASRYQADRFRSLTAILRRHAGNAEAGLMEQLAESEHRRWVAERVLAGWRAADIRVDALRRHNCIVPYNTLSEEEKQKDRNVVEFAASLR